LAQLTSIRSAERAPATAVDAPADLETVYEAWAQFVWLTLQRLGVRYADLEDVCHDVFLVAHRKFAEFDGRVKVNAWLFGICVRIAANYRRRARFRFEHAAGSMDQDDDPLMIESSPTRPDDEYVRREAQAKAQSILDRMDLTKRAVFLMFEIEGMSCQEIATQIGVPVGTVYSRLHGARAFFEREARRTAGEQEDV
jgi:RNA polymerase sigma-70 factor (ECF subfamily)